ncbi:hypothetical protein BC938DRAFT_474942 [Jimgerdemannia flammicorona]|uniref:Pyrroline-5-carboxylate reductase catalytic N-terminal domain-containing protein n=1 Tax=Jimgerdemannia flammicorona TaxID=994334 RepID=A0A433QS27_9FUNG|nr:hypothetical protein BC938DRAFT_474942 [Jimgerdemannia flammicorona]
MKVCIQGPKHPPTYTAASHPTTHLTIGILGSGNVGQTLASGFLSEGPTVILGTRDSTSAKIVQWLRIQTAPAQPPTPTPPPVPSSSSSRRRPIGRLPRKLFVLPVAGARLTGRC